MDKLNFQNGVTKVNAETFNTFQDNIDNAISDVAKQTIPAGGLVGQILTKKGSDDYNVKWQNQITIVDNLTSTNTTAGLSANQGKVLNDKMTLQGNRISAIEDKSAHVLYTNESGSRENITLSDDVSNYSYIKIHYRNDINIINSQEFLNCNNKDISLFISSNRSDWQASWLQISRRHVSGNKITVVYSTEIKITNDGAISVGTGNYIFITKVEGFK